MTRILFLLPFRAKKQFFSEAKKQFSRIKFFFGGRPPNLHFLTGWDLQSSKHLAEFRFGIFIKKGDWGISPMFVVPDLVQEAFASCQRAALSSQATGAHASRSHATRRVRKTSPVWS